MKAPDDLFEQVFTEKYFIALQTKIGSGEKKLELDFSDCKAVSAYTVARLIALQKQLQADGGSLSIIKLQPNLKNLLLQLHINELLNIN